MQSPAELTIWCTSRHLPGAGSAEAQLEINEALEAVLISQAWEDTRIAHPAVNGRVLGRWNWS